jgi:hypothetical protein
VSDILNARAVEPAPMSLSAHLRCQLLAQYRADLRNDRAELATLTRIAQDNSRVSHRRTHRIGALALRIAVTRQDIADLLGGA